MFNHFLSFDYDVQKRLQQFHKQVEALCQQKESQTNDGAFDEQQFLQRCNLLRKELNDYKQKIEGMKNMNEQNLKENTIKDLKILADKLSNLMTPEKIFMASESVKMFPSKKTRKEKNRQIEETNNVHELNRIDEVSSKDSSSSSSSSSSSDPDYASDHASDHTSDHASDHSNEERHRTEDANLKEELKGTTENTIAENNQFIALANFEAQEKNDLTLQKNELIRIIATREDGWWLAENKNGDRGFVPKTFLKVHKDLIESREIAKQLDKPLPMPRQSIATKSRQISSPETIGNEEIAKKSKFSEGKEQQNETNIAVVKDITAPTTTSNIGQIAETTILEESNSENSKTSEKDYELSKPKIRETTLPKSLTQPIVAASDIFERSDNYRNHLTYECYLAPRLSESNYAFHDIYWNYEDDRLRKRRVRVSKMIKIIRLENIYLNAIDVHCRLVRAYLFDRKTTDEEHQIVSNVYTIKAHSRTRESQTWIFSTSNDIQKISLNYPSFIIRSNYKQKSVVLCLEAAIVFSNQEGEMSEQSLGCIMLPIINESGQCCIKNKHYTAKMFARNSLCRKGDIPISTQIQITFRVSDVPNNIVHQVDSLPDIILCNVLFLPMFFYYRRLLGQFLTKDSDNWNNAALKAEPFLATFPAIADQPDIMEILLQLWKIHKKNSTNKKLSEAEEAELFRSFFLMTGFILHQTIAMPKFDWANARCFLDRQTILGHFREQYLHNFDVAKYLSRQRCHPINIYNYAVDITGPHAIS